MEVSRWKLHVKLVSTKTSAWNILDGIRARDTRGKQKMTTNHENHNITTKEYLQQVRNKFLKTKEMLREREKLNEQLYSLGGNGNRECVQQSKVKDKITELYAEIDEMDRNIVKAVDEWIWVRKKIQNEIKQLQNNNHIRVLTKRYVEFQDWSKIAEDMGYSIRYIFKLHGRALMEFDKKILKQIE